MNNSSKSLAIGLLILRAGVGFMMMTHGWSKLFGGPEKWETIGAAMGNFGFDIAPAFWGFMAGFAETVGGLCLALGLVTQGALGLLLFTMVVAATKHLEAGQGLKGASHAIELGLVFLGLLWTGPGAYSLDHWVFRRKLHPSSSG